MEKLSVFIIYSFGKLKMNLTLEPLIERKR